MQTTGASLPGTNTADATGGRFGARELAWLTLVFVALWAAAIVLFAMQLRFGNGLAWGDALARSVIDRGPWALLSPFIMLLVWRLHRAGLAPWRTVVAHLAGVLAALLAAEALVQGVFLKFLFPLNAAAPLSVSRPFDPAGMRPPSKADFPSRDGFHPKDGFPPGDGFPRGDGFPPKDGSPAKGPPRLPSDAPGPVAPPPDRGGPPPDFSPDTPPPLVFAGVALRKAYNGIPLYLLIAALAHAFFFWRNLRAREQRLSLVEERLLVARADMLRLQLEPHFLFNTLNAIGTLVYRDAALADDLIGRLSTLLRRLLDLRDERTISLDAEMETLRAYVGIEQARFGERLRYEESIDAAARAFPVPVMLLQPLAENAVRHGIEPLGRPGTLWVTAGVQEERLAVCIEDDGVGMGGASDSPHGFGLGLTNASVRLRAMYGTTASIASMARSGGGTRIEIRLPRAPLADAAAITISEELRA